MRRVSGASRRRPEAARPGRSEDHPTAARALRRVERAVGIAHQGVGVAPLVLGEAGDAEGGAQGDPAPGQLEVRLLEPRVDPLGEDAPFLGGGVRQEDDELVAP